MSEDREIAYRRLESELQLFWQRNNYAWLIMVGAMTALGYLLLELGRLDISADDIAKSMQTVKLSFMVQIMTAISTIAAAVWLNMIKGGRYWIREWELKINTIERGSEERKPLYKEIGKRAFFSPVCFCKKRGEFKNDKERPTRFYRTDVVSVTSSIYMMAFIAFWSLVIWSAYLALNVRQWYPLEGAMGEQSAHANFVTVIQLLLTMFSMFIVFGWTFNSMTRQHDGL